MGVRSRQGAGGRAGEDGFQTWVDADNPTQPRKVHVTLRLDGEVAKWFWRQGEGYQARMNAVLRAYMMAKAAKVVE